MPILTPLSPTEISLLYAHLEVCIVCRPGQLEVRGEYTYVVDSGGREFATYLLSTHTYTSCPGLPWAALGGWIR